MPDRLWGTVDKDAVEFLQDMWVNAGAQVVDGPGNIAMLSQMRSSQETDKLQNGKPASKEACIGGMHSIHVDGCLIGIVGVRSIASCKVRVNVIILSLESEEETD
jgi:hypothetical protein